ncbi:M56 family metallopeptidase [Duganella radicis]|uniref:Peptidase M56 domain-containing protein n=1 Tax=Duganella radicis TaxID=551988 RepID=A0A6L6PC17_9BURK|nr:M56 family metallopeptidase [Duganella radicis]MTV36121.1 hypothetical protein [Duganella radicis]
MTNDILHALLACSVTGGGTMLLICALRIPLRRIFGARLAYLAWSAVPATIAIALLPAARLPQPIPQVGAPFQRAVGASESALLANASDWPQWLLLAWLTVCVLMLVSLWRAHIRYRSSLGPLRWEHGVFYSASTAEGPAAVGLWHPAVVVPADFATRYTPEEQRLILAHEAVHVQRRDPLINALWALTQCALWFNPLVHYAARKFRLDQELACDAVVMQRHPGLRRSYAEAMLKTQMSAQAALIHCHWQSNHPLKERIMQLQQTPPRRRRMSLGRLVVGTIVIACGMGAMAANTGVTPADHADEYLITMKLNAKDQSSSPALLVREGVPAAVESTGADGVWRTELMLKKAGDASVFVKAVIKRDDRVIGEPGLLLPVGETAAVAINDDVRVQLTVGLSKRRD